MPHLEINPRLIVAVTAKATVTVIIAVIAIKNSIKKTVFTK